MKTAHPITPPPELVQKWMYVNNMQITPLHLAQTLATQAARWGADQELEACCVIAERSPVCGTKHQRRTLAELIRERRRPKPPSLKAEVRQIIECLIEGDCVNDEDAVTLRRALEALPNV